jgi:hypothetical protein
MTDDDNEEIDDGWVDEVLELGVCKGNLMGALSMDDNSQRSLHTELVPLVATHLANDTGRA